MSACLFLVPLAVAVITSAVEGAAAVAYALEKAKNGHSQPIQTVFNSREILIQSLVEHGAKVSEATENCIVADFGVGKIQYSRQSSDAPFEMEVFDVEDMEKVSCNVKELETEYGGNVQSYTYNRVKSELPEGMVLESEEVLEDNTIVLTLTVG